MCCIAGHTLFKIPIAIDEFAACKPSASYKSWLRSIHCFIWDEISMAHKWALDSVDRLLQDIHSNRAPFGGVTMVLSGDMQQLLPVHRFARDPAAYCIKACSWFSDRESMALGQNVRAADDPVWAAFVAGIGRGLPAVFPTQCMVADVDALLTAVWPGRNFRVSDVRSILTMTRDDAQNINKIILDQFPGVPDYALSLDAALVRANLCVCPLSYTHAGLRPVPLPD